MNTQAKPSEKRCLDKNSVHAAIKRWSFCLAPSAIILAVICMGAGLHLSLFELSWSNDCVFALLVIALMLPLTKLPLLFFDRENELALIVFPGLVENAGARALQIQILRASLEHLNKE